jgi:uncharacterized membrane protein
MDLFRHRRKVCGGFRRFPWTPGRSVVYLLRGEVRTRVGGPMNGAAFGIMIGIFSILSLIIIQRILDNPNS